MVTSGPLVHEHSCTCVNMYTHGPHTQKGKQEYSYVVWSSDPPKGAYSLIPRTLSTQICKTTGNYRC